jgi:hypothetical protein
MTRNHVLALVSIAILGSAAPSRAQDQCVEQPPGMATINGSVLSENNSQPVFSNVIATGVPSGGTFSTVALLGGAFSLQVAAPATYVISASPLDQLHAPEFYNGVLTQAAAQEISVDENEVVNGINFTVILGGTISGTVTAQTGGDPIEGVIVQGLLLGDLISVAVAQTEADGTYTLGGLAPTNYQVSFFPDAESGDFLIEVYNDKQGFPGDPVAVTLPGVDNIDAALATGGRIEGTVTGPGGALDGVAVSALTDGPYKFGAATTDESGNYSILAASGTYNVFFSPDADVINEFYNDKPDLASADDVAVTAPQTTENIDAVLAASGKITGRVTDTNTGNGLEATVTAYDSNGVGVATAFSDANGDYEINANLRTGQYRIGFSAAGYAARFFSDSPNLAGADEVTVTAPNTTPDNDQDLIPCDEATTTTTGPTTTTLPTTTTTLPGGTTTTSLGGTTTTSLGGTTTTSLGATTTTTLGSGGECGDPVALTGLAAGPDQPRAITASDALFVLRTGVGSETCVLCVCDVNASGGVTASDALIVLRNAVGQSVALQCPACSS